MARTEEQLPKGKRNRDTPRTDSQNIDVYVARIDHPPSIICANECTNTDVRKVNVSCLAVDVEGLSLRLQSIHPDDWGIIAMMFAVCCAVVATFVQL